MAVIISMGLILLLNWNSIPDKVPIHFTFDGTADGYGSKTVLIIEPIIAAVLFALITIVQKFPRLWNFPVEITRENMKREYLIAHIMFVVMKVMMTALLLISMLASLINGFPSWPIIAVIAVMLASIIGGIVMMIRLR